MADDKDKDKNKKYRKGGNDPQNPEGPADDPSYYVAPEDRYDEIQAEATSPAVSAPAAKNFVFIGLFALIVIAIVYFLFSGGKEDTAQPGGNTQSPSANRPSPTLSIAPPPEIDVPPPPAPEVQVEDTEPKPLFDSDNPDRLKRIQSDMLVTSGGILGNTSLGSDRNEVQGSSLTEINDNDPNTGFADGFFNQKDAPFAQARKLGDTSRLIIQGKIMESVLETPINTDVPGMIRAIVSRDIYAESGRNILIPKGSRLVGTYNNFVIRGNKRINIIWSRVIRPDGIDIMIRSGGTDQLGRAGVMGEVDNKYAEIFASAFLVSAINIAVAAGADAISGDDINETTNTDGSTTRNTNAVNEAGIRAVDMFGNAGQNLIDGFLNLKPTITIDQGTRVNVFVNRDLIFPANLVGQVRYIQ